jgi:hypothetical protein
MTGREGGILHRGLLYGLKYHPWYVLTGLGRKPEIPGQVRHPAQERKVTAMESPPESAIAVIHALDALVLETALAPDWARIHLVNCGRCRNHLLYLLDTAPYSGRAAKQIRSRLRALGEVHKGHTRQGEADRAVPKIRGLA